VLVELALLKKLFKDKKEKRKKKGKRKKEKRKRKGNERGADRDIDIKYSDFTDEQARLRVTVP